MDDHAAVLYIDCARPDPCVGLLIEGRLTTRPIPAHPNDPRGRLLHTSIVELMQDTGLNWQQLSRIAVGNGPGPMTGTRVGIAAAVGIATACHLDVTAIPAWYGYADPEVVQQQIKIPVGPGVAVADITISTDGWRYERAALHTGRAAPGPWRSESVARAIHDNPAQPVATLRPIYLREPDAEPQFDAFGRPLRKPVGEVAHG